MSLEGKTLKVCSCNRTVAVDAAALAKGLKSGAPLVETAQLPNAQAGDVLGPKHVGHARGLVQELARAGADVHLEHVAQRHLAVD